MISAKFSSAMAFALGLVMLPAAAQAGTGTATSTASFTVGLQCSVTGATVNLGTYKNTQYWYEVANSIGYYLAGLNDGMSASGIRQGTRGWEYANFGSITCDAGTPYSLLIKGTSTKSNMVRINVNSTIAVFMPAIKRLGGAVVPDNAAPNYVNSGHHMYFGAMSATGTGAAQALLGSAVINLNLGDESTVRSNNLIGTNGSYADTMTYTLNF